MTADSGGDDGSRLLRRFDGAAGNARARVTGRIGLQIVFLFMNDNGLADDGIRAAHAHFALPIQVGLARSIGLNVPEIALMAFGSRRATVLVLGWIEVRAG